MCVCDKHKCVVRTAGKVVVCNDGNFLVDSKVDKLDGASSIGFSRDLGGCRVFQ